MKRLFAVATTMLFALCLAQAQTDPPQRGNRGRGAVEQQPPATSPATPGQGGQQRPAPPLEEKKSVTQGSVRIGGQQINYTATAANYIIKADDGSPKASFFSWATPKMTRRINPNDPYRSYTTAGRVPLLLTRTWAGPKRIVLTDDGFGMPGPYSIVENGDSFLDATDMVFVDAISTGYSRPAPGENTTQFYGLEQDATYFADFIYQYLTRNERWASPKFLIGENYGTTRSAQLSYTLQRRHQIYLNCVALLSAWDSAIGARTIGGLLPADFDRLGLVSQSVASRPAKTERRRNGAKGAPIRARRLRRRVGEGRRIAGGGTSEGR